MKLRRSLLLTGAPLAAGMTFASTALAAGSAPAVTVRVEGATRSLLETKTVSVPSAGSVTKGGTPTGACPEDSAAGALARATRGRWNGTYYKGLGIDVSTILGTKLSYSKGAYWGFYLNDRLASQGICDTKLVRGESLLFAPVPAKGKTPRPVVVKAPRKVSAGKPFELRAFVYTGSGDATESLRTWHAAWNWTGPGHSRPKIVRMGRAPKGEVRFKVAGARSGKLTLVVSAKGEIRSAATAITVVK